MADGELQLRVDGDDADRHLRALHTWLRREDEFRGRVALRNRPIEDGQMGGALDFLIILVGSGTGVTLARSLSTWLTQNRADVKVTIAIDDKGRKVTVDARRAKDVPELIREVKGLLEPDPTDQQ
jgi:hypothetical protein